MLHHISFHCIHQHICKKLVLEIMIVTYLIWLDYSNSLKNDRIKALNWNRLTGKLDHQQFVFEHKLRRLNNNLHHIDLNRINARFEV